MSEENIENPNPQPAVAPTPVERAVNALRARFGALILAVTSTKSGPAVVIEVNQALEILRFLRDDLATHFEMMVDLTAVDWPDREPRFDVVYQLLSLTSGARLSVKMLVGEDPAKPDVFDAPSATVVWPAANYFEREVFDLFGLNFVGHPDMRRIMMPEDWEGHPLRKDYPVVGLHPYFNSENDESFNGPIPDFRHLPALPVLPVKE